MSQLKGASKMAVPDSSGGIFISYRREETSGLAGRLYDRLANRFGEHQVFMDVDSIEPGLDFSEVIRQAIGKCAVLLVIIGTQWLTVTDSRGARRIDDPDDLVRLEVEAALARNVRVIPVLIEGAVMPNPRELPDTITTLAQRNAFFLRHESFRTDIVRLEGVMERLSKSGPILEREAANTLDFPQRELTHTVEAGQAEPGTFAQTSHLGPGDVTQTPLSEPGNTAQVPGRAVDRSAGGDVVEYNSDVAPQAGVVPAVTEIPINGTQAMKEAPVAGELGQRRAQRSPGKTSTAGATASPRRKWLIPLVAAVTAVIGIIAVVLIAQRVPPGSGLSPGSGSGLTTHDAGPESIASNTSKLSPATTSSSRIVARPSTNPSATAASSRPNYTRIASSITSTSRYPAQLEAYCHANSDEMTGCILGKDQALFSYDPKGTMTNVILKESGGTISAEHCSEPTRTKPKTFGMYSEGTIRGIMRCYVDYQTETGEGFYTIQWQPSDEPYYGTVAGRKDINEQGFPDWDQVTASWSKLAPLR